MTDRELLELAAKAVGMTGCVAEFRSPQRLVFVPDGYGSSEWNPLTDDGDALRLAVKLDLIVEPPRDNGFCHVYHYVRSNEVRERRAAMTDAAEQAATRRAIVRAAAEIGKAMP